MHPLFLTLEHRTRLNQIRWFRTRSSVSQALTKTYRLENNAAAKSWPPIHPTKERRTFNEFDRLELLRHLRKLEVERMKKLQQFEMPDVNPGDLVEIRYELSRTQQTQAVFQGYCVDVRKKDIDSSFVLKNTYDGIGVTQLVPKYSPRLLNVKVSRKVNAVIPVDKRPSTKDYRYRWHKYTKHGGSPKGIRTMHKPGILSLEPRIQNRLKRIWHRYHSRRVSAGLPPYTYGTIRPTNDDRRIREIRSEIGRRMLVYTYDAIRKLKARTKKKKEKQKWGVYKITKVPKDPALTALPLYHPLVSGNLPK